jgi:hypothetical protein
MVEKDIEWVSNSTLPGGTIWLSIGREDQRYLLRFAGMADFTFDPVEQTVSYTRLADIPQATLDHLYRNQVMPLIKVYNGETVLHGSAVAFPLAGSGGQAAAAFLGEAGQGKSTLAAALCQAGFSMITDDSLTIEEQNGQILGQPGYPGIRLWPDAVQHFYAQKMEMFAPVAHYTDKRHIPAMEGGMALCDGPVPVRRVYFLANNFEPGAGASITLTPVTAREAFMGLMEHAFRLDNQGERIIQEFELFSRLAGYPLYYRLSYPRVFSVLPEVCQAVRNHFQEA